MNGRSVEEHHGGALPVPRFLERGTANTFSLLLLPRFPLLRTPGAPKGRGVVLCPTSMTRSKSTRRKARSTSAATLSLPVLPLRDVVIFPSMIFPVLVGRESSLRAAAEAINRDKTIMLVAQRNPDVEEPGADDIHRAGTIARIVQMLRLPNGLMKILVEGEAQGFITDIFTVDGQLEAKVRRVEPQVPDDRQMEALQRQALDLFRDYVGLHRSIPPETLIAYDNQPDPMRRLYFIAGTIIGRAEEKQGILEMENPGEQYLELLRVLREEIEVLRLEQEIDTKVQDTLQRSQRQFIIQEQIRALQTELEQDGELSPEFIKLAEAINTIGMPEEVQARALEELDKLRRTPTMSPEFSVNRNYLEWLVAVPWTQRTADDLNVEHVREVLDEDHYGLERPKERIIEHIAVLNLVREMRGQILCLVGPPGVGKTSLGRSIARALGRTFIRVSLGGVRDEAEIRGHRRTYIGAMPGKVIQSMKRAGSVNPVLLLDEVDKMSADFRGDPSSAMLEVLDPEQNVAFNDHYLEVDYDLSKVLFIATANVLYNIPLPLQDRMEIIELNGYLENEKLEIAKRHIIRKQLEEHGLADRAVTFTDEAILKVIREYTSEAGVRSLEREIASLCRKIARRIVEAEYSGAKRRTRKAGPSIVVTPEEVERMLKAPRYRNRIGEKEDLVGAATGLAWTSVGGDTLTVEVSITPGPEKLTLTGQLGDVMKESAAAALSYIRANAAALDVPEEFMKGREIHIHVPEGAIPKDGPSAGITMATAIISAATLRPVRSDVAMTGEITLRGRILPIGGLTEKLIAARRVGVRTVVIPRDNLRQVEDIAADVKEGLEIIPVSTLQEAVPHLFRTEANTPEPITPANGRKGTTGARSRTKKSPGKGTPSLRTAVSARKGSSR